MSKVKRFLAILVAAIMTLGMTVSAFAGTAASPDGKFGTSGDTGTITVTGIETETSEDFTVEYYRVIAAQYNNNGSFSGYKSLYKDIITDESLKDDLTDLTADQLNRLADAVANVTVTGTMTPSNGNYVATVTPGTYLVLVKGAENKSYNPMVVSVAYERKDDGTTGLKEDTLTLVEGTATAKKSGTPEVAKKIVDSSSAKGTTDKGNSAEIGKDVNYEVSINPIPNYNGSYPKLQVEDTLSAGLTFNGSDKLSAKVVGEANEIVLRQGTDYTVSTEGQKITVNFVVAGKYTLNEYAGKEVVINYSANVSNSAALNEAGNNNDVVLRYTKDSKVENNDNDGTKEDKTYTYTFEIDGEATGTTGVITKTGDKSDADQEGLNGALFALYKSETDAEADQTRFKEATSKTINGQKGQLNFKGLEAGTTYYLREILAPTGYSVNTHIFTVLINATYNTTAGSEEYGQLIGWEVLIDGNRVALFSANSEGTWTMSGNGTDILNTKISSLPSTGGIGTTIFTIGGCAIMIVAAGLFFATRRKTQK